jgi:hypothetical protein
VKHGRATGTIFNFAILTIANAAGQQAVPALSEQ